MDSDGPNVEVSDSEDERNILRRAQEKVSVVVENVDADLPASAEVQARAQALATTKVVSVISLACIILLRFSEDSHTSRLRHLKRASYPGGGEGCGKRRRVCCEAKVGHAGGKWEFQHQSPGQPLPFRNRYTWTPQESEGRLCGTNGVHPKRQGGSGEVRVFERKEKPRDSHELDEPRESAQQANHDDSWECNGSREKEAVVAGKAAQIAGTYREGKEGKMNIAILGF